MPVKGVSYIYIVVFNDSCNTLLCASITVSSNIYLNTKDDANSDSRQKGSPVCTGLPCNWLPLKKVDKGNVNLASHLSMSQSRIAQITCLKVSVHLSTYRINPIQDATLLLAPAAPSIPTNLSSLPMHSRKSLQRACSSRPLPSLMILSRALVRKTFAMTPPNVDSRGIILFT